LTQPQSRNPLPAQKLETFDASPLQAMCFSLVSDNSLGFKTVMITKQLNKLNDTTRAFLNNKNFVMDNVFGADQTRIEAVEWKGYWTYGLKSPEYTHKATLQLPTAQSTPKSIHLPALTLQDLLNPVSLDDEKPSFFVNDPYNAASLDDNEDEDDEQLFITHASDVQMLKINKLVDLTNSKLIARYSDSLETASSCGCAAF